MENTTEKNCNKCYFERFEIVPMEEKIHKGDNGELRIHECNKCGYSCALLNIWRVNDNI